MSMIMIMLKRQKHIVTLSFPILQEIWVTYIWQPMFQISESYLDHGPRYHTFCKKILDLNDSVADTTYTGIGILKFVQSLKILC